MRNHRHHPEIGLPLRTCIAGQTERGRFLLVENHRCCLGCTHAQGTIVLDRPRSTVAPRLDSAKRTLRQHCIVPHSHLGQLCPRNCCTRAPTGLLARERIREAGPPQPSLPSLFALFVWRDTTTSTITTNTQYTQTMPVIGASSGPSPKKKTYIYTRTPLTSESCRCTHTLTFSWEICRAEGRSNCKKGGKSCCFHRHVGMDL